MFNSCHRQATERYVRRFEASGGDFLATLVRKRKVDGMVVAAVKEELRVPPLAHTEALRKRVCECLGREDLSCSNIEAALDQISCRALRRVLGKQLEEGEVHYREGYLVDALFSRLLSMSVVEAPQLEVSEAEGASFGSSIEVVGEELRGLADKDHQALEGLFEEQEEVDGSTLGLLWQGAVGIKLLAFVLYFQGISLSVLGSWFGVHKSTVCRWLSDIAKWGWAWLGHQRIAFSGQVAVDEKWVKIGGIWGYLFAAVDCLTGYPLHLAYYPSNSGAYCKVFLLGLKHLGYLPKVIVTDGWDSYIQAIGRVFPGAEHVLCRVHLLRSVFRRLRKAGVYTGESWHQVGLLFPPPDKRTVRHRGAKLQRVLEDLGEGQVVSGVLSKLPQVLGAVGSTWRPSTTNAAEGFFAAFDRLYRIKGPFCDPASAEKHPGLFLLGDVFGVGAKGQAAPLERTGFSVGNIPFSHLFNRPNVRMLRDRMAAGYRQAA